MGAGGGQYKYCLRRDKKVRPTPGRSGPAFDRGGHAFWDCHGVHAHLLRRCRTREPAEPQWVGCGQAGSRAALGGPPEADGSGCCPVLKDGSPTTLPALAQAGAAVDGQEFVVLGWGLSAGGLGEPGPRGGHLSSQQVEDSFPVSGWG